MNNLEYGRGTRREFLRKTTVLGVAGLAAGAARAASNPIKNVLICCNENRSFDHYYGYAPFAGSFGVPAGYSQPDGQGGRVTPFLLTSGISPDPNHDWAHIHSEWNNGAMDGFVTTNGKNAVGYYDASMLSFYYSLAKRFALCGNYFCSVLGPTYPNRLYPSVITSKPAIRYHFKTGQRTSLRTLRCCTVPVVIPARVFSMGGDPAHHAGGSRKGDFSGAL